MKRTLNLWPLLPRQYKEIQKFLVTSHRTKRSIHETTNRRPSGTTVPYRRSERREGRKLVGEEVLSTRYTQIVVLLLSFEDDIQWV